jgi:tetratricopeptide (TPR) repeat protein
MTGAKMSETPGESVGVVSKRQTRRNAIVLVWFAAAAMLGAAGTHYWLSREPRLKEPSEPFFDGLGPCHRVISTGSGEAQRYFDQGLAFLYGFNHKAAFRSFLSAACADPHCAMAFWGIAMADGPYINSMEVPRLRGIEASRAIVRAAELSANATPVERALIAAAAKRYADPPPADLKPLNEAYAAAMREVWAAYPDDPDVGALTAEAIIDLRPWNQWTRDGKPEPGTEEAVRILETVLAKSPEHPMALHLLIHALEASPHPERADMAASRLRDLAPGLGHLLHMPSHIDVRLGRWQEAVVANEKAIAADTVYRGKLRSPELYEVGLGHNRHMLAYAAMMQGQSHKATEAVQQMLAAMPKEFIEQQAPIVDGYLAMPYELHLRFGQWREMLAEPAPGKSFPLATALWRYARGIAFAAQNQVKEAQSEEQQFLACKRSLPRTANFRKVRVSRLLGVAEKMLEGEILFRQGKPSEAVKALREATALEDRIPYTEPPTWVFPVRHALGAVLVEEGRSVEAEGVYREDLSRHPHNGWALYGLARSLKMQGKKAEAATVSAQFEEAWKYADMKISSSCCCLPETGK